MLMDQLHHHNGGSSNNENAHCKLTYENELLLMSTMAKSCPYAYFKIVTIDNNNNNHGKKLEFAFAISSSMTTAHVKQNLLTNHIKVLHQHGTSPSLRKHSSSSSSNRSIHNVHNHNHSHHQWITLSCINLTTNCIGPKGEKGITKLLQMNYNTSPSHYKYASAMFNASKGKWQIIEFNSNSQAPSCSAYELIMHLELALIIKHQVMNHCSTSSNSSLSGNSNNRDNHSAEYTPSGAFDPINNVNSIFKMEYDPLSSDYYSMSRHHKGNYEAHSLFDQVFISNAAKRVSQQNEYSKQRHFDSQKIVMPTREYRTYCQLYGTNH